MSASRKPLSTTCDCCGAYHEWQWEEAFDKFGFNDGDGLVMTSTVADALRAAGYTVKETPWGLHNVAITSIKQGEDEAIPVNTTIGYDDPREYLPTDIVDLLDRAFVEDPEVGNRGDDDGLDAPGAVMSAVDTLLEVIAQEELGITTLETRNSDSLDFHDIAVWKLRKALLRAYQAGCSQVRDEGAS